MPNSKRIETYTLRPSSTQSSEQRDSRHHSLRISMQPSLRQHHIQHSELSSRLKIEGKRVPSSWGRARVTKTNLPAKTPRPNLTKTSQKQKSKASVSIAASSATENTNAGARRKMHPKRCNCGRTGYTGPTGRTGPRHDPPDPSAYSTHTSLPRLAS